MKFIEAKRVLEQLSAMLGEAKTNRDWGAIEIDLKDGQVVLLRTTRQFKVTDEEIPDARPACYARR
jgi:hypothetical protein